MDVEEALRTRRSIKSFDLSYTLDDATLKRIFDLVALTPSSYNLQHWRFVVVRSAEGRARLRAAAYGQRHVEQCSAVVVVCAKLHAHEDAARTNAHAPQEVLGKLVPLIEGTYGPRPQLQRDEAIRSASLASMNLMLVTESMGLATCPMIGFDPAKVAELVGLPEGYIPVLVVTLGKPGEVEPFPTSRLPLEEVVHLERFDGPGLK